MRVTGEGANGMGNGVRYGKNVRDKSKVKVKDRLEEFTAYRLSLELWDEYWCDSEILIKDIRSREIAKQLTRSVGSISANIEEGYGRGFGKEYPQFLRFSRGSARESKGWFKKSKFLLGEENINKRIEKVDSIIAILTKTLQTLENKKASVKS